VTCRSFRSQRGFTLVELLVGVVISLVAIAGAVIMLQAQKRSFQGSSADRALQETGRMALGTVSQDLRLAGYGVEPAMVFDFGQMTNVPMERAPQGPGKTVTFGGNSSGSTGFACGAGVTCRDSVAGPDELVFQFRNPYFNHLITAVPSSTSITIAGPLNQPIRAGQVLQAVCLSGSMVWAYVRVAAEAAATTDPTPVTIQLEGGVDLEYPHQNEALADTCFANGTLTGGARLLEVERRRYFVQSYDAAGQVVAWNSAGSRPYLMLDRGLRAAGGALLDVVAPDVEDFQVSYVFPLAAVGSQVAGSTPGTQVDNSNGGIDFAPPDGFPTYSAARLSAVRTSHYPSNIRAVRVSTVVRSPNPDPDQTVGSVPAAGNRPAVSAGDPGYRRMVFETSVATPNMESRAPYFPTIVPADNVLNVGGG
jgi:type IV pilus assembly protein PilW